MTDYTTLPTYSIYLIGFIMLIMLIAIICLSLALYMALRNKQIFGFNIINKQYVRQESSGVMTLYTNHFDDPNKNDGSTLTVNSGIIEVTRVSEPPTPTREETKIVFAKKPIKTTMVPIIQRGQMDEICKEVLKKVQKSDSASYRDLNELLNASHDDKYEKKFEIVEENEIKKKLREIKEDKQKRKKNDKEEDKTEDNKVEEIKDKTEKEQQAKIEENKAPKLEAETKTLADSVTQLNVDVSPEHEKPSEMEVEIKPKIKSDVKIEIEKSTNECTHASDEEPELYDTVPSPVRCKQSGDENEDLDEDSIPVYDLPPRNHGGQPRCMVQIDQEGEYLFPIMSVNTNSCYVNAKRSH